MTYPNSNANEYKVSTGTQPKDFGGDTFPEGKFDQTQKEMFYVKTGAWVTVALLFFLFTSWTVIKVSDNELEASKILTELTSKELAAQILNSQRRNQF
jgi:hypothetical protein